MTVKQKEKEKGNVSRPLFTACGDDRRFPQTFSEKKIRQPTTAVKQNHHFGKRQGCAEHIYQTDANELKGIKKSSAAAGLCAVGKRVPTMLRFTATCTYILFVCLRFVKFSCIHKYYALRRADHCFRWSPRVILLRDKKQDRAQTLSVDRDEGQYPYSQLVPAITLAGATWKPRIDGPAAVRQYFMKCLYFKPFRRSCQPFCFNGERADTRHRDRRPKGGWSEPFRCRREKGRWGGGDRQKICRKMQGGDA